MNDKEKYINRKIKELQDNFKLSFKMTEEIIDISYRQAVNDIQNFNTSNKKSKKDVQTKPWSENTSKKLEESLITGSPEYNDKLNEYLKNKDDFEKFLSAKNNIQNSGRYGRYNHKTDEEILTDTIKKIKLDIYRKIIDKIDSSRDLLYIYDYCRKEVEKINETDIWP